MAAAACHHLALDRTYYTPSAAEIHYAELVDEIPIATPRWTTESIKHLPSFVHVIHTALSGIQCTFISRTRNSTRGRKRCLLMISLAAWCLKKLYNDRVNPTDLPFLLGSNKSSSLPYCAASEAQIPLTIKLSLLVRHHVTRLLHVHWLLLLLTHEPCLLRHHPGLLWHHPGLLWHHRPIIT